MNGIVTNMHKDNHIYNELLNNFKFHKDNNAVLINMYTFYKKSTSKNHRYKPFFPETHRRIFIKGTCTL